MSSRLVTSSPVSLSSSSTSPRVSVRRHPSNGTTTRPVWLHRQRLATIPEYLQNQLLIFPAVRPMPLSEVSVYLKAGPETSTGKCVTSPRHRHRLETSDGLSKRTALRSASLGMVTGVGIPLKV